MAAPAPSGLKRFYVILAVVAAVGLGALFLQSRRPPISIPANVKVTEADTAGFQRLILGNADAPVEVTVYADYQCPACAVIRRGAVPHRARAAHRIGTGALAVPGLPAGISIPQTRIAAHAAACANDQGKYWEMHRFIYESQNDWSFKQSAADQFRSSPSRSGSTWASTTSAWRARGTPGGSRRATTRAMKVGVPFDADVPHRRPPDSRRHSVRRAEEDRRFHRPAGCRAGPGALSARPDPNPVVTHQATRGSLDPRLGVPGPGGARRRLRRHRHQPAVRPQGVLQPRARHHADTRERARDPVARVLGAELRRVLQVHHLRPAGRQPRRGRHPRAAGAGAAPCRRHRAAGGARSLIAAGLFGAALLYGDGIITPGDLGAWCRRGPRGRDHGAEAAGCRTCPPRSCWRSSWCSAAARIAWARSSGR